MSLSALRASSSRLPRATAAAAASRSIFSHANTQAASPRNAAASSGAIGGVDPRVLTGVPGFVGKEQMSRVNEWQATLWERLQAEVRNNPRLAPIRVKWDNDKLDMTDLLAFTAREPSCALAFNYASLLLNNSYYLEGLHAGGSVATSPDAVDSAPSAKAVPENFSALEDRVAAYADGIVGSGWLWLVKNGDGANDVDVVPTFGAGTLLVTMNQQRGRQALQAVFGTPATSGANAGEAVASAAAGEAAVSTQDAAPAQTQPAHGQRFASRNEVTPVAVLSLFEHAYLGERYGVGSRAQYAKDWFRALDWDKVQNRVATASSF